MKSLIILATLAFANGATVYPAGVDPNACPNYPFCGATAPADFPTPVVNGQPIAPILNTTPEQTAFWQKVISRIISQFFRFLNQFFLGSTRDCSRWYAPTRDQQRTCGPHPQHRTCPDPCPRTTFVDFYATTTATIRSCTTNSNYATAARNRRRQALWTPIKNSKKNKAFIKTKPKYRRTVFKNHTEKFLIIKIRDSNFDILIKFFVKLKGYLQCLART